jgi:toxin ParE1/3/4
VPLRRLRRTPQAKSDLEGIWLHIAKDNPEAADRLFDLFDEKFRLFLDNPKLGPARDDIRKGLRYLPVRNYLILYREVGKGVEIVRVVHGARQMIDLL